MRQTIRSTSLMAFAACTLFAAACSNAGTDATSGSDTELRAGAASRVITPVYWEAWTDLDGNHRFDGDLDDPDGGEPWVDANGNGRFDTLWLAGSYDGRAISAVHDDLMVTVTVFGDNEETVALAASMCSRRGRISLIASGPSSTPEAWTSTASTG